MKKKNRYSNTANVALELHSGTGNNNRGKLKFNQ